MLEKHKLAAQMLQTVNDLLSAKGVMLKSGTAVDATLIAVSAGLSSIHQEQAAILAALELEKPTLNTQLTLV